MSTVATAILQIHNTTNRDLNIEDVRERIGGMRHTHITTALDLLEERGAILIRTPHLVIINTRRLEEETVTEPEEPSE